ncbi:hypothetical protein K469DRAFT_222365 [Zopfia rhizophila CBS 207.26]|uniref:Zn(2)-C6 fungal-type domain-containing protein n=1 Tax=Zopfia rhizophila CBS 207.26 TaxID=1314779 RepID=A0A6A6DXC0_9PEZI|nr:hypothetical protein K469DRAFT_222365 [Zopfia rhizophila CBS 207.26]
MPSPCSRCRDNDLQCLVNPASGRCSECVDRNVKCDLVVTQPEWNRLDRDKKKLQEQLRRAQEETVAARSRELRLHRQLAQIDSREKEMFQRELASIDEVRAMEEEEQKPLESIWHTATRSVRCRLAFLLGL